MTSSTRSGWRSLKYAPIEYRLVSISDSRKSPCSRSAIRPEVNVAGVARRDDLIAFLDELLDSASFDDYGPNGLQVVGSDEVAHVVTGVSAHRELFERAAEASADMVLCHHGILWGGGPAPVDARLKGRLVPLFDADMSLVAYHLPLDAHPEVGNNALICHALGLRRGEAFGDARGRP